MQPIVEERYAAKIEQAVDEDQKTALENKLGEELLGGSYLGSIGKFMEPAFEPLGFDWKMTVALQTGLAAKEVVVSTLGVLYSLGGDVAEDDNSLMNAISSQISFASAVDNNPFREIAAFSPDLCIASAISRHC